MEEKFAQYKCTSLGYDRDKLDKLKRNKKREIGFTWAQSYQGQVQGKGVYMGTGRVSSHSYGQNCKVVCGLWIYN